MIASVENTESTHICQFCLQNICSSTREWDFHHRSSSSLEKSALGGEQCTFCITLLNDIRAKFDTMALKALLDQHHWPVYRWNLRKQGYLREAQEVVVLTFRPIIPSGGPLELIGLCEALPDRTFHFYHEQDMGPLPSIADLGASTNSLQSWKQIHQWMDTCLADHKHCRRKRHNPDSVPTRLLDLAEVDTVGDDHGNLRIVDTSTMKAKRPYMTLSHFWGKNPNFLELNRTNVHEFTTTGIDWNHPKLPQNFKDAMIIARRLRIRYIWIDSLCIVQRNRNDANDPGEDFKHEGFLMHKYYRNSFCNICAADSGTAIPGLFRDRQPKDHEGSHAAMIVPARLVPKTGSKIFGSRSWRIVSDSLWNERLLSNVLYFRAWVFQERMLSPRILHFSKHQIFWECSTLSACEGLPYGIPRASDVTATTDRRWRLQLQSDVSLRHRPLAGEEDASIETLWKNAVRKYTSCNLTNSTDKLVAIWSVAKLVGDALQEAYAMGIWSNKIEEQLAWRVVDCRDVDGNPSARIGIGKVPSWSWASMRGIIELQDRYRGSGFLERTYWVTDHNGSKISFKFEEEPQDDRSSEDIDEPPRLATLSIAIQGHLRRGRLMQNAESGKWELQIRHNQPYAKASQNGMRVASIVLPEAFPDIAPEDDPAKRECWTTVLAYSPGESETFSGIGIMLEQQDSDVFSRIGAFRFNNIGMHELNVLVEISKPQERLKGARKGSLKATVSSIKPSKFWLT